MKKINFKEKKYVLPLLALPFLLLFIYVGAQFTNEDTSKKDQPKELSLSLGETKDRFPKGGVIKTESNSGKRKTVVLLQSQE